MDADSGESTEREDVVGGGKSKPEIERLGQDGRREVGS